MSSLLSSSSSSSIPNPNWLQLVLNPNEVEKKMTAPAKKTAVTCQYKDGVGQWKNGVMYLNNACTNPCVIQNGICYPLCLHHQKIIPKKKNSSEPLYPSAGLLSRYKNIMNAKLFNSFNPNNRKSQTHQKVVIPKKKDLKKEPLPSTGLCRYKNTNAGVSPNNRTSCKNLCAWKRNGEKHSLCTFHRDRQNETQKKSGKCNSAGKERI